MPARTRCPMWQGLKKSTEHDVSTRSARTGGHVPRCIDMVHNLGVRYLWAAVLPAGQEPVPAQRFQRRREDRTPRATSAVSSLRSGLARRATGPGERRSRRSRNDGVLTTEHFVQSVNGSAERRTSRSTQSRFTRTPVAGITSRDGGTSSGRCSRSAEQRREGQQARQRQRARQPRSRPVPGSSRLERQAGPELGRCVQRIHRRRPEAGSISDLGVGRLYRSTMTVVRPAWPRQSGGGHCQDPRWCWARRP